MRPVDVLPHTWNLRALSMLQLHPIIVLQPHLLVVPDTEDPYCPAPQGLVAPPGPPLHAVHGMVRHPKVKAITSLRQTSRT